MCRHRWRPLADDVRRSERGRGGARTGKGWSRVWSGAGQQRSRAAAGQGHRRGRDKAEAKRAGRRQKEERKRSRAKGARPNDVTEEEEEAAEVFEKLGKA